MARFKAASLQEVPNIIRDKIMPEKMRKYLNYTYRELTLKTPFDTYTAANSWIVSQNVPSPIVPTYKQYPGFPPLPGQLRSGSSFKATFSGNNLDLFYIVNNQPYIGKLEAGGTKRFPTPFIRPTITKLVSLGNAGAL